MKYLQYFETTAEFDAKYNSINYCEPWTSWDNQTETISLNNHNFPKFTILTKSQVGNTSAYRYTTDTPLYGLIPGDDIYTSYRYTIFFNNVLFTANAKNTWTNGSYPDEAYNYLRMASSSSDPYYNYYFFALTDEDGYILSRDPACANLPDSFGEVGDVVTVRIYRN